MISHSFGVLALVTSGIAFGQTQVPNIFQAGQPARAAEVNDNFSTLESAANQNASDIASNTELIQANTEEIRANGQGIQVLAAGTSIGLFVEFAQIRPGIEGFRTLSNTGYFFDVMAIADAADLTVAEMPSVVGDLYIKTVWFESASCTGATYTGSENSLEKIQRLQGFVFRSADPADPIRTYYVPAGSQEVDLVLSYRRSALEGGCVFLADVPTNKFVPVLPNDPTFTGVPSTPFDTPVLLGH